MTDQIKTIYSKFVSPVKKSTGIDLSEIGHAHAVNIILQELQNDNRTEKEKRIYGIIIENQYMNMRKRKRRGKENE